MDDRVASDAGEDDAGPVAKVEGALNGVGIRRSVVFHPHEVHADHGKNDAEAGDQDGQEDRADAAKLVGDAAGVADHGVAEHHSRQHSGHVGTEQVGAHAGHVAHVVAHVVGDGSGVAGVIFRNTGFHLAHQVGAHIGGFGVNTAAHTGKQRDGLRTERETGQHFQHARHGSGAIHPVGAAHEIVEENGKQRAQAKYSQTGHAEAHDRTAVERHLQGFGQTGACGLCGAHVGFGGDAHTGIAGQHRKRGADNESHHDEGVAGGDHHTLPTQQQAGDHHIDGQYAVFSLQKGHGAVGNVGGNGTHLVVARILLFDPCLQHSHVQQSDNAEQRK